MLSAAFLLVAHSSHAAPTARCDADTFDFGAVADSDTVKHTFQITNAGDAALTLAAASICCGATAKLPSEPVAPGATADIAVELTLRGRRGAVNKPLYLSTNDPKQPMFRLALSGKVKAGLTAVPSALVFADMSLDLSTGATVRLSSETMDDVRVTNVWTLAPWLSVTAGLSTGNVAELRVKTVPPLPDARSSAAAIQVGIQGMESIFVIPVTLIVREPIQVFPGTILLSHSGTNARPVERMAVVTLRDKRDYRVQSVRLEGVVGKAEFMSEDAGRWRIVMKDLLLPQSGSTGTVVIATDHPTHPEIRLPVVCTGSR